MILALLIARLIVGLGMAAHGAQKLFGWFGGYGIKGTGGFMESLGFKPGATFALLAGLGEFTGGMLLALGWLGGLGPALIVMVMLVAILTVHLNNGFFTSNNGWEMPGLYIAAALAFLFFGFGAYSLDGWTGGLPLLSAPNVIWMLLAGAIVLALLNLLMRKRPPQANG